MDSKLTGSSWLQNRWAIVLTVVIMAIIGAIIIFQGKAATTAMWLPTADKPLKLTWILGDIKGKTGEQLINLQTKDLNGSPIAQADVYDIDGEQATKAQVSYLQSKGKKVICYFDAGVYESYRSDANKFPKSVIGKADGNWEDSYWLDIRQITILEPIMKARIKMCKDKGFDSIEPDEINNYSNKSGFPLTYQDQIRYNTALANWAHEAGISIGLKGDTEQARDLSSVFDWTLNEQCYEFDECLTVESEGKDIASIQSFSQKNKAVWIAEYPDGDADTDKTDWSYAKVRDKSSSSHLTKAKTDQICNDSIKNRFNTAFYVSGLPSNSGRTDCPPFPARNVTTPTTTTVSPTTTPTTTVSPTTTPTTTVSPTTTPPPDHSVDKNPPTAPSQISRSLAFDPVRFRYNLELKWVPSADAEGKISYYTVKRNSELLGSTEIAKYTDSTLTTNVRYSYELQAYDMAGNASPAAKSSLTAQCFLIWCWLE